MRKAIISIRTIPEKVYRKHDARFSLFVVLIGLTFGIVAKATDSISLLGDIGTDLGIWIFIVTLITAYSRTPIMAMINAPMFFIPMLASYYFYGHMVLGFFPKSYFMGWLIVSLVSPVGGLLIWFSRGKGWVANVCAAIPISVLFASGYTVYYTFSSIQILNMVYAVALIFLLPKTWQNRAATTAVSIVLACFITQLNILKYLPW